MTSSETIEERIAKRKADEEALRQQLRARNLDGPHEIAAGAFDPLTMFGGGPFRYAICLTCGSIVKLDDAAPNE